MDNPKPLQKDQTPQKNDVLITGGYGLLGCKLDVAMPNCHRPTHSELDVSQNLFESSYFRLVDPKSIRTVIHCAALKNEQCQNNPVKAMTTNIIGTANVALFCDSIGAKLVYISTDYVFRGDKGNYRPSDEVGPSNYYGETKLASEYVVKSLKDYLIIRLSFFPDVFPYEKAFIDQITTRITVTEAAERIKTLVSSNTTGVKHISGPKRSSYEFALATAGGKQIQPISLSDDPLLRPKDSSLLEE